MGAIDDLELDLAHARRIVEARATFDQARGGRPERWAPPEARDAWAAVVREVIEARGGSRGAYAFVARSAGIDPSSIWRTLHGRDAHRAA